MKFRLKTERFDINDPKDFHKSKTFIDEALVTCWKILEPERHGKEANGAHYLKTIYANTINLILNTDLFSPNELKHFTSKAIDAFFISIQELREKYGRGELLIPIKHDS